MKNYLMISTCLVVGFLATPVLAAKENYKCVDVQLTNTGYYQLNTHYTACDGKPATSKLAISQTDAVSVRLNDTLTLEAAGASGPIDNVKKGVKIDGPKDITCSGATLFQATCDVESANVGAKTGKK